MDRQEPNSYPVAVKRYRLARLILPINPYFLLRNKLIDGMDFSP